MNYVRTALLLAAMTALFLGAGYLLGGEAGMVIAFLLAMAMNFLAYWLPIILLIAFWIFFMK